MASKNMPTTLRRQVIILRAKVLLKSEDLADVRKSAIEQMKKDGVIVLSNLFDVFVADADCIVVEEAKE